MQRLLVIFALGLTLLLPACAVQDLPFSGSTADQDNTAPAPYRPQQGAVYDGSNDGGESFTPPPMPADRVPMPAGVAPAHAPTGASAPAAQGMQHPAPQAQDMPAQSAPAAAPKPVTKTASGLSEREL